MQPARDLKSACLETAITIVEEVGVEKLSLREVARRLGVSHQAPYKHFASRDHILAEIVARIFSEFAAYLGDRPEAGDPWLAMRGLGLRYFAYAAERPLQYQLMFSTLLPPIDSHPDMMVEARRAFALLRDSVAALPRGARSAEEIERDALFVWSTIHGLVAVMGSDAYRTLEISQAARGEMIDAALDRIGAALASR